MRDVGRWVQSNRCIGKTPSRPSFFPHFPDNSLNTSDVTLYVPICTPLACSAANTKKKKRLEDEVSWGCFVIPKERKHAVVSDTVKKINMHYQQGG